MLQCRYTKFYFYSNWLCESNYTTILPKLCTLSVDILSTVSTYLCGDYTACGLIMAMIVLLLKLCDAMHGVGAFSILLVVTFSLLVQLAFQGR